MPRILRGNPLDALLLHVSVVFALAVLATCHVPQLASRVPVLIAVGVVLASHTVATAVVSQVFDTRYSRGVVIAAALITALPFMLALRPLTLCGRFLVGSQLQLTTVAVAWGLMFVWQLDISAMTRALMLSGVPLLVVTLPFGILAMIPQWEVLSRHQWRRPRAPLPPTHRATNAKVSLHVPICS